MSRSISDLIEALDGLLESHAEYADAIDDGNIDAHELHNELGAELMKLDQALGELAKQRTHLRAEVEEIEVLLGALEDAFAELAAFS